MTGCVLYLRVSTGEQLPESQETVVRDYALGRGYTILATFRDTCSGSVDPLERKGFRELLDYARETETRVVVMYDITRFYRAPSPIDALRRMREIMDKYGIIFEFAREPVIEDPFLRELWLFMKTWFSSYERFQIGMRTRYGMRRVKEEGRLYHRPSLAHYFASVVYGKPLGQLTKEEVGAARLQLKAIVGKYWHAEGYEKKHIARILEEHEPIVKKMYQVYPRAPRSYAAYARLMKK